MPKFVFTKKIDNDESCDYIATAYKIKFKDKYKRENEVVVDKSVPYTFLRTAYTFDNPEAQLGDITLPEDYRFELLPYIPLDSQEDRSVIYVSGSSGAGKSYLINNIVKYYKKVFPKNNVYFITKNNWKMDRSLEHSYYKFLDTEKFIEDFSTPEAREQFLEDPKKVFNNSFFIFDDIGALDVKKEAKETIWFIINTILENKRKSQISIAIISHVPTDYKKTQLLIREIKQYIIFPQNLQVKSDRLLNSYLGLTRDQLKKIVDEDYKDTLWLSIDIKKRLCLTQRSAYSL